jgi:hypothetical protein
MQKKSEKWQPRRKPDLLENQLSVGFRFVENRLVLVSVSHRALAGGGGGDRKEGRREGRIGRKEEEEEEKEEDRIAS